jgi:hypothetical protein
MRVGTPDGLDQVFRPDPDPLAIAVPIMFNRIAMVNRKVMVLRFGLCDIFRNLPWSIVSNFLSVFQLGYPASISIWPPKPLFPCPAFLRSLAVWRLMWLPIG